MAASFTFREFLAVGGIALLCAASGVALLLEGSGHPPSLSMADAVDLLRVWARI